ncbi:MAG: hypothetical protein ABI171_20150 [Collimonas sp.]
MAKNAVKRLMVEPSGVKQAIDLSSNWQGASDKMRVLHGSYY